MASEGANSPGTMANDDSVGTGAWGNVNSAKASDGSDASTSTSDSFITNYLKATNFGFSIPNKAVILGIKVKIEKKATSNGATYFVTDEEIRLVDINGDLKTTNKADTSTKWETSDTDINYGDSTDLWESSWDANEVNNSNFGTVLSADVSSTTGVTVQARVDHISITIYYETANPNKGTVSTTSISKQDIPEGIGDIQNLVPEGQNGVISTVLSKERVLLEL